jgi:hypothetical protein
VVTNVSDVRTLLCRRVKSECILFSKVHVVRPASVSDDRILSCRGLDGLYACCETILSVFMDTIVLLSDIWVCLCQCGMGYEAKVSDCMDTTVSYS